MWSQRAVVDYGLARLATLASLRDRGPTTREDACDAHPFLLRAAMFQGELTDRGCPVCGRERLREVHYAYGDELGRYSGRVRTTEELTRMAHEVGEFRVYVVEVCTRCSWNHLVQSFLLGDGVVRAAPSGRAARR